MADQLLHLGMFAVIVLQSILLSRFNRQLRDVLAAWKATLDSADAFQHAVGERLDAIEHARGQGVMIVQHGWRGDLTAKRES